MNYSLYFSSHPSGNSSMLPMMNSGGGSSSAVSRASLAGQLSRPPQQGLTAPHSSFSMQQQLSPASAVIGSPSHGAGLLMGGQSGHGMAAETGSRNSAPGMMSMNMGLPLNKPNMRLGGVGISQPANFPGGLLGVISLAL